MSKASDDNIISGMKKQDRFLKLSTLSTISTIGLIILMLCYLVMTLWSSTELAGHTEIISGHPFEVVTTVGDMQSYVSEMRVQTERLMMHNSKADVELVRNALESIRSSMEEQLEKIRDLYLGAPKDIDNLLTTLTQLKETQNDCLKFAQKKGNSLNDIEQYEEAYLSPLYTQVNEELEQIISSAQAKKLQYGQMADSLRNHTLIGSLILIGLMIGALLLSQYALRRQRKELMLRSQLFDNLSTSIDDAFLIRDAQTEEIFYTALNMERVIGYKVKKLEDVYLGFQSEDANEIRPIVRSGNFVSPLSRVIEYTLPSREKRWISVKIYRAHHLNNPLVISVFSDCTDEIISRQALQDALLNAERANASKSEFLSRMSHEIRTPMNAITGMTAIAEASVNSPDKIKDCLNKIKLSSKHLLMLINDVLDMSKIESQKMALQKESFDLFEIINSFVSTTYMQAKSKGVEFKEIMEGFQGDTRYIGDSLRLNQILLNLGSNAVKFTPPGGTITLTVSRVATKRSTDTIRFVIQDTGIGMTPEALVRIFQPFEQADATIAGRFGGTGLGMSITKNLVSLMSGHIEIQSEPGAGTACIVDLPLLRDKDIQTQSNFANMGLHALVVDDEQTVCMETAAMLKQIEIQAQWVLTGAEAVDRVIQAGQMNKGFDFCLIDWKIPDMDGIEITRRIRANIGPNLPIIIISSYDCTEIEEEARAAGANAFLPKPIYRSSIFNVIETALGMSEQNTAVTVSNREFFKGKRLLMAEDNELNREIVVELLTMYDIKVICAADGQEAFNTFLNSKPGYFDAILMDVQMPVMNGYEATQKIRTCGHPDAGKIPIIATTANAFSDDISASLAAGMNAHVGKPINIDQLFRLLIKELS